ncbi:PspC domain-containing protein [Apilactobacillus zhangqiuensis]|uniref:PspC domain-containing protein n=1 Tax=Apilactobacillus zhangqiuensis TaxID=2841031 RepID=UPI001C7D100E|nr:PspC domain-containing protein [Apilactobacillus zhangqiuensis]
MTKIYRSQTDRVLTGLLGGVAEYFHINSQLLRIIFVVLSIYPGHLIAGLLIYLICLVIVPVNPNVYGGRHTDKKRTRRNLTDVDEFNEK